MTYLDTHVALWLYQGELGKLSRPATERIHQDALRVSPIVLLEMTLLREIGRVKPSAPEIVDTLNVDLGLEVCGLPLLTVIRQALRENWVRDPFDRLIVAHARANDAPLITKDELIRRHYRRAVW
ncbi:MAG: type II toxin-antitoxin system VapC family toxin [Acidobacteria bacterium]|nr:type II toxin-antitoxin system VapC family toxin [Acidobacteriota bacterium]MBI3470592.1 type II toxin-antitoxin system VapC family toxin [Candidatus Solibacter usitatus]